MEEVNAKLLITDDEVKIPVNEAVYGKIKIKKSLLCPKRAETHQLSCGVSGMMAMNYGKYEV